MLFSFGQPKGGIIQTAFIVPDLDAAIQHWVEAFGVGPWFVIRGFEGDEAVYRGQPSGAKIDAAMAFAGHMQIELIEQTNTAPSVYEEVRLSKGHGFHHFGVGSTKYAEDEKRLSDGGFELAYKAKVPTGDFVAYYDAKDLGFGFIELIEASAAVDKLFNSFYEASLDWDGSNPVRPMI